MKRSKITGIIGTVAVHLVVLALLLLITLSMPPKQEEGGVPVMLGNTQTAQGDADPYQMTEVDLLPPQEILASEPESTEPDPERPVITQEDEPSIKVKKEKPELKKSKEKASKKPQAPTKPTSVKPQKKTEAEKQAEQERAAAEAASRRIAGAFGRGSKMGSRGNAGSGTGIQGSPTGNSATGKTSGIGGYGEFDLNGRSLGSGHLPIPAYNVQDEGRVVVTIVVDPSGKVISTSINKRTNTVNPSLRKAAEEAARRARFNQVDGVNNQTGTITYYFKLK